MINQISTKDYTSAYVDASPSELIHNSDEMFLCVGLVHFFRVDRKALKNLSQFKKTRGLKRKIQTQEYIITKIKENVILPNGLVSWNYRDLALKNGSFILENAIVGSNIHSVAENIKIGEHDINLKLCTSLSWYSIVISIFLKYISQIAKIEHKKNVAIFLDLLPGDNINNQRNFEIIEYIINNSRLSEFQTDALRDYELQTIGYGYGILNESTKEFKNDFEFVITDWIIQSFHSLLKYEKRKFRYFK
jgi:hypothetical protein